MTNSCTDYFQVSEIEYGWIRSEPVETLQNHPLLVEETIPRILLSASPPKTDLVLWIRQAALTGVDIKTKMRSTCKFLFNWYFYHWMWNVNTFSCTLFVWRPIRETIQKDMEIWESSGQWPLSCYSVLKGSISGMCMKAFIVMYCWLYLVYLGITSLWLFSPLSNVSTHLSVVFTAGFVELSQDELRLEYYNGRASGDLQTYVSTHYRHVWEVTMHHWKYSLVQNAWFLH